MAEKASISASQRGSGAGIAAFPCGATHFTPGAPGVNAALTGAPAIALGDLTIAA
jgi:hypothetical protein